MQILIKESDCGDRVAGKFSIFQDDSGGILFSNLKSHLFFKKPKKLNRAKMKKIILFIPFVIFLINISFADSPKYNINVSSLNCISKNSLESDIFLSTLEGKEMSVVEENLM